MAKGQRIKAARKKAGLTQKELGQRLGVSYQTVAQWENDLRNPKYETLKKIADALNIDVALLFTDREREISEFSDIDGWLRAIDYYNLDGQNEFIIKAKEIFDMMDLHGYSFSSAEKRIVYLLHRLNEEGQMKAVERVEELTEIPKYQLKPEAGEQDAVNTQEDN